MANARGRTSGRPVKFRRARKKVCGLCASNVTVVDYKEINTLRKYMSDRGKIAPRRITGLCPKHQRSLSRAIKRSREIGIVPYVVD